MILPTNWHLVSHSQRTHSTGDLHGANSARVGVYFSIIGNSTHNSGGFSSACWLGLSHNAKETLMLISKASFNVNTVGYYFAVAWICCTTAEGKHLGKFLLRHWSKIRVGFFVVGKTVFATCRFLIAQIIFSSLVSSGNRKQSCLMFLCYLPLLLLLLLLLMLLLSFPLCNTHTILLSCFFCLSCFGCCVSVACSFAFYFFLRPLLWVFVQTRTHTGKSLPTLQDCCCFWWLQNLTPLSAIILFVPDTD